jgi:hypothetical protein
VCKVASCWIYILEYKKNILQLSDTCALVGTIFRLLYCNLLQKGKFKQWKSHTDHMHITIFHISKATYDEIYDTLYLCPTRYRIRHFFNNFTTNEVTATKFEAHLPHCVQNVKEKNILLFKFRCNVCIGVTIIKEMPGLVVSGTPCICLNVI